jgi:hypothetical protein
VVPAEMRVPGHCQTITRVGGPTRLVLTVEFASVAEPVEGLVHCAERPTTAFSGWSELFAVLMARTSEAAGQPIALGHDEPPAPEPDNTAISRERRNPPCE